MSDADVHRHEWIEERAAIREFSAGMPRPAAEVMARLEWQERKRQQPPAPDNREAPGKAK